MLFCILGIGRVVLGAVKERYWFFPCLISWSVFRGDFAVLWLSSLGWRRLACHSSLRRLLSIGYYSVFISCVYVNLVCNGLRGLLPDTLGKWWKFWYFICPRSVTCSSGVKTWRFYFEFWAAAWRLPSE